MAQAAGVFKTLAYKVEATYGTVPSASGPVGQALRRVTSDLSLTKQTYQSNEIRPDQQVADFRHGVRSVEGTISGELSPKTYGDFMAAVVRQAWPANLSVASLAFASAVDAGSVYKLTRGSGSWLTDGFKVGDVIRILSATGAAADNLNKNFLVTDIVALVLKFVVLSGSGTVTPSGTVTAATVATTGKKTFAPSTAHTNLSYSIEHWFADVTQGETFSGCVPTKLDLQLPPTGMATVSIGFLGQNVTTATAQYFTTPTAVTSTGVTAAVNGKILVGGVAVASITGMSLSISSERTGDAVVGSNTITTRFPGRITASGQLTAYFEDAVMRDLFLNETESSICVALTCDNTATSSFIAFTMPRVKVGGASKSDGAGGLVQTLPFVALYNSTGGSGVASEKTTISIQDSDIA